MEYYLKTRQQALVVCFACNIPYSWFNAQYFLVSLRVFGNVVGLQPRSATAGYFRAMVEESDAHPFPDDFKEILGDDFMLDNQYEVKL